MIQKGQQPLRNPDTRTQRPLDAVLESEERTLECCRLRLCSFSFPPNFSCFLEAFDIEPPPTKFFYWSSRKCWKRIFENQRYLYTATLLLTFIAGSRSWLCLYRQNHCLYFTGSPSAFPSSAGLAAVSLLFSTISILTIASS